MCRWIVGLLYLESCPPYEVLRERLETKLVSLSRFKSVLKINKKKAYFEEVEELDWEYHLGMAFQDKKITEEELTEYVGNVFERGLDLEKPLWRITIIPELDTGKAVLIGIINHAIGDGVSNIGVVLNLMDDSPIDPTQPLKKQITAKKRRQRKQSKAESKEKSGDGDEQPAEAKENTGGGIVMKRKKGPQVGVATKVGMFFHGIKEGVYGPFGSHDPPNALKIKRGKDFEKTYTGKKLLARSEKLSLDEIKDIKSKFKGATVNDVLLTVLTMTVKAFLEEIDDPVLSLKNSKSPLRGNFPVNLRSSKEALLKGNNPSNKWQPLAFRFPFDFTTAVECLWKVKSQVDKAKVSPQLPFQNTTGKVLMNVFPKKFVLNSMLNLVNKVTCMLSNVPGPQQAIHLTGVEVTDMNFYLFSPVGLYLGLMSYNGSVSLSINMDETLNLNPEDLTKHWAVQYQKLKDEVAEYPDMVPKSVKKRNSILANYQSV